MKTLGIPLLLVALAGCAGNSSSGADPQTEAPASSPTSTVSSTVSSTASSTVSVADALASIPEGAPPAQPYVLDATVHTPDGAEVTLDLPADAHANGLSGVTASDAGWLVADSRLFEGSNGLFLFDDPIGDPNGAPTEIGPCASGDGAASDDGQRLAWVTFACDTTGVPAPTQLHVRADGETTSVTLELERRRSDMARVIGFDGDLVVITSGPCEGLCRTWLADPATGDLRVGEEQAETEPLPDLDLPRGVIVVAAVPEDDDHTLALIAARDGEAQTIVRVGPDGALERVVPVVNTQAGYQLVTTP